MVNDGITSCYFSIHSRGSSWAGRLQTMSDEPFAKQRRRASESLGGSYCPRSKTCREKKRLWRVQAAHAARMQKAWFAWYNRALTAAAICFFAPKKVLKNILGCTLFDLWIYLSPLSLNVFSLLKSKFACERNAFTDKILANFWRENSNIRKITSYRSSLRSLWFWIMSITQALNKDFWVYKK